MDAHERRLIRRLKDRDERAFREMVLTYQQPVYNLIFRMIGLREEAEDLAQEVFVTVFKAIDSFRGDSQLGTWIYSIAVNQCRNRFKYLARRHYHRTQSLDQQASDPPSEPAAGAVPLHGEIGQPDALLEGKRLESTIQQAIAALDEEHRLLIVLRDVQGLSYQEICRITGMIEGTVKSRLHRARMMLKERLEPYL
jgi:RNA polymerase sigma-70 factor (ECF subfamily)